ncbi:hypothetical protein Y882_08405 [Dyella japonica DSM 16301]|uniref:Uncharacterized protein n=1 Tax=Dyella japonica DSM 16301 TaxID=1440762 RepID=A0A0G9H2L1_9GAMM|nr:hypothetical protein Y882_08405 [Dyella japonica DSM 16301]
MHLNGGEWVDTETLPSDLCDTGLGIAGCPGTLLDMGKVDIDEWLPCALAAPLLKDEVSAILRALCWSWWHPAVSVILPAYPRVPMFPQLPMGRDTGPPSAMISGRKVLTAG